MTMEKNPSDSRRYISLVKGSFLVACPLVFLLWFSVPVSGQVVALFESSHDFLTTDNGQSVSQFQLETDRNTYTQIVTRALSMPETLILTSRKIKKNLYHCSILFTHPTEISYVKKTLLYLGIEQLKINNTLYPLQEYNPEG